MIPFSKLPTIPEERSKWPEDGTSVDNHRFFLVRTDSTQMHPICLLTRLDPERTKTTINQHHGINENNKNNETGIHQIQQRPLIHTPPIRTLHPRERNRLTRERTRDPSSSKQSSCHKIHRKQSLKANTSRTTTTTTNQTNSLTETQKMVVVNADSRVKAPSK